MLHPLAGVGYSILPCATAEAAYRQDHWNVDPSPKSMFRDGYALVAQLSWSFDVNSWLERPL